MFKKYLDIKSILKLFLIWMVIILFGNKEVYSTHIIGGNLTYRHVSGETYQVKLVLRRDCLLGSPEAEFDDPASIGIFTSGGTLASWLANNGQIRIPFMSSDTLNEFIRSDCGFEGTQVCVHETTYQGLVNLPFRAGGYTLSYQRCCRNQTLANIQNPLETGSTYWVNVTEDALLLQNSSPEFKVWPDVYICANRPLVFDLSANDINGDSLVYKICVPSTGATQIFPRPQPPSNPPYNVVQWALPYSLQDMMGGEPLKIDSKTGVITANPNLVGQFLIGICVEEYRNGKLISTVRRDFQYNVRVCSQPPLAQFATSESNCDGLTVEFTNESLSSSNYTWYFDFPNEDPAFISTETNPVFTYPASGEYQVKLRATRGSDGCFDTILQTVAVFTNKIEPDFNFTLSDCKDDQDSLTIKLSDISIFNEPGYLLNEWNWIVTQNGISKLYTGANPEVDLSYFGDVSVTLTAKANNGCQADLTKEITIANFIPSSDFTIQFDGCPDGDNVFLKLTDISAPLNPFATIIERNWIVAGNSYTGEVVIATAPKNSGPVTVESFVRFGNECTISTSKTIDLELFLPRANYTYSPQNCPDDNNVTLNIKYLSDRSLNLEAESYRWEIRSGEIVRSFDTEEFDVTVPKDSLVHLVLVTSFKNGCVDTLSDTFLPGPFATIKLITSPVILCPGQQKYIVTNPNPDWTYTWSPLEGLDLTEPSNPLVSVTQNTTYFVTVTDGLCTVSSSISIIALEGGVILDISGEVNTCDNIVNLSVSGGIGEGQYVWSTDRNFNTVIDSGSVLNTTFVGNSATFFAQFEGELCSTDPAFFTVTNQDPEILTVNPFNVCRGDTLTVTLFNEVQNHMNTYLWENDPHIIRGADTDKPMIGIGQNEVNDFYLYYNVKNQFGCQLRDSILIKISENPTVDFSFQLMECGEYNVCFSLEGNYEGFIKWDFGDPSTNSDVSLLSNPCYTYPEAGTYTVTLENLVGVCPFVPTIKTFTVSPQIALVNPGPIILCQADTITLNAASNVLNARYLWSDVLGNILGSGNTLTLPVTEATKIILEGQDGFGCTDEIEIDISIFNFEYNILQDGIYCENDSSIIRLNIQNPENYIIQWSPVEQIISGSDTPTPIVRATSDVVFSVILTDKNSGCISSDSIKLNLIENPVLDFEFNLDECGTNTFCFNIIGNYTGSLSWNFGDPLSNNDVSIENSPCYTYTTPGTYSVLLESTGNICPFIPVIKTITVNPQISLNSINPITVCIGDTVTLIAGSNIPNAEYFWSDGAGNILSTLDTFNYQVLSDVKIYLNGQDNFGCTDQIEIDLNSFDFMYDFVHSDPLCFNENSSIRLNIANPQDYTIQWFPSDHIISGANTVNPIVRAVPGLVLNVSIVNNIFGCTDTATISPAISTPFNFSIEGPEVFCYDQNTTLNLLINSPELYRFNWSPAASFISGIQTVNPVVRLTSAQTLTVNVVNISTGCMETLSFDPVVGIPVNVSVNAEPDLLIYEGEDIEIFVTDPISGAVYQWSTGQAGLSIIVAPVETTTYIVTVTDQDGCTAIDQVTIEVRTARCDETDVYLPNAFTPNGDGNNDILYVRSNFIDELELIIYNRWGQEVFRTNDINMGWDGTFKGKELPPDAYAYYLRALCINTVEYKKRGNVSLLR